MRKFAARLAAVTCIAFTLGAATSSSAQGISGTDALEVLKKLAGTWNGTMMTKDGPPTSVIYEVTSGGSAVTEKLFVGTDHEMLTVYHLEDQQLVATHYCSMGNQPTMRLDTKASDTAQLVFQFDKVTGLKKPDEMHIHHGTIRLPDADRLESSWSLNVGTDDKKLFLNRVKTET